MTNAMKTTADKIISKLSQESTWRGIIAIATAFGATIDPVRAGAIIAAGLTVIGFINILKKD
jgi:hypothetical protein